MNTGTLNFGTVHVKVFYLAHGEFEPPDMVEIMMENWKCL